MSHCNKSHYFLKQVGSTAKVKFDFTTIADAKNITFYYQVSVFQIS